jgi:Type III flagellar switch regulator (C-ring) FliN C-term
MDSRTAVEAEGATTLGDFGSDLWSKAANLPTPVMVAVAIPKFRVRDVLALRPGCILSSAWQGGDDVPLLAGEAQFAWVEFEVTDDKLSARITRFS